MTTHTLGRWLEIEGVPYAFGSFTRTAGFFSTRTEVEKFLGIKPSLMEVPKSIDQSIDTLQGGAQTSGAANFKLGDIEGQIAQLLGTGYQTGFTVLTAEILATDTTIPYPSGGGAAFTAGGYCYIGSEAIKIGSIGLTSFTGCTRGCFKSKPQAFGVGLPVGTRPYTMANRRVWYYQTTLSGDGRQDLTTAVDGSSYLRLAGKLNNLVSDEPNIYQLSIMAMDAELDTQVFRDLRQWTTDQGIGDATGNAPDGHGWGATVTGYPGSQQAQPSGRWNNIIWPHPTWDENGNFGEGGPVIAGGEYVLVRIDDEIFLINGRSDGSFYLIAREMLGTTAAFHARGAVVEEIVAVIEKRSPSGAAVSIELASKFEAVVPTGCNADHPLAIVLQLLCSTGAGTNGNYDTLPEGWGEGIDEGRVDITGIELVMTEEPDLRFGGVIEKPTNFIALVREILSFAGYYYYIDADIFHIKRVRPPEPDAQSGVVQFNDSKRIRNSKSKWDANWSGAVREIRFTYAWDLLKSKFKIIDIFKSPAGDLYSKGKARTIEYKTTLLYPGHSGIPGEPPFPRFDIQTWLITRASLFKARYGRPPPILHERMSMDMAEVAIGDIVEVTYGGSPSTVTGTLGIVAELGEIIGKSIDDVSKTITFTVLLTGWQLGRYRYIAGSVMIDTVPALNLGAGTATFNLELNEFTRPTGPGGDPQVDLFPLDLSGAPVPIFSMGHTRDAYVWNAAFTSAQAVVITAWDNPGGASMSVATQGGGAWPFTPAAGMILTPPTYDQAHADILAKYAYAARSTDLLGGSAAAPHIYFPT